MDMDIIIQPGGTAHCIYGESVSLSNMGQLTIQRASHVEPDSDGRWIADLSPVGGPQLGPFANRSDALAAEVDWLQFNWLTNL